jgi:Cu2+-exporting ATPase
MSNHIITSSPLTHSCYHCHTPLLPNESYEDTIGEEVRYFCCSGCLAIAMTIHAQGLDIFYTRRSQASPKPLVTIVGDQIPEQLLAYDDPLLLER